MSHPRKTIFVLDCSVTMSWLFTDETDGKSKKLASQLELHNAIAPSIWSYEVGNVLLTALRRKRISEAIAEECKSILNDLPIEIDDTSTYNILRHSFHLAHEYKLSLYDAAYLELSMRHSLPLASFDKSLITAAKKAGIEIA